MQDLQFLLGSLGVTSLLGLSACGACDGMMNCGTSSTLHAQKQSVVTYSYVSMIMISTVFFYGFILAIIIVGKIGGNTYSLHSGIMHFTAGLIFGLIGLHAGKVMGNMSKKGFERIAEVPAFYTSFMISLASVEVTLVIGFLCSLLVIYKA
jgi:F0F1-type ATP synthase membrane subunit c/vacuolar-type H+-ATPase subunit K